MRGDDAKKYGDPHGRRSSVSWVVFYCLSHRMRALLPLAVTVLWVLKPGAATQACGGGTCALFEYSPCAPQPCAACPQGPCNASAPVGEPLFSSYFVAGGDAFSGCAYACASGCAACPPGFAVAANCSSGGDAACTPCPVCDAARSVAVYDPAFVDGLSCRVVACSPKTTVSLGRALLHVPFFGGGGDGPQVGVALTRHAPPGRAALSPALLALLGAGGGELRLSLRSYSAVWGRDLAAALYVVSGNGTDGTSTTSSSSSSSSSDTDGAGASETLLWTSGSGAATAAAVAVSFAEGDYAERVLRVWAPRDAPPLPARDAASESPLVRFAELVIEGAAGDMRLSHAGSSSSSSALRVAVYLEPAAASTGDVGSANASSLLAHSCSFTPAGGGGGDASAPSAAAVMSESVWHTYVPGATPGAPPQLVRAVRQRLRLPRALHVPANTSAAATAFGPYAPFAWPSAGGGVPAAQTASLLVRALTRIDVLVTLAAPRGVNGTQRRLAAAERDSLGEALAAALAPVVPRALASNGSLAPTATATETATSTATTTVTVALTATRTATSSSTGSLQLSSASQTASATGTSSGAASPSPSGSPSPSASPSSSGSGSPGVPTPGAAPWAASLTPANSTLPLQRRLRFVISLSYDVAGGSGGDAAEGAAESPAPPDSWRAGFDAIAGGAGAGIGGWRASLLASPAPRVVLWSQAVEVSPVWEEEQPSPSSLLFTGSAFPVAIALDPPLWLAADWSALPHVPPALAAAMPDPFAVDWLLEVSWLEGDVDAGAGTVAVAPLLASSVAGAGNVSSAYLAAAAADPYAPLPPAWVAGGLAARPDFRSERAATVGAAGGAWEADAAAVAPLAARLYVCDLTMSYDPEAWAPPPLPLPGAPRSNASARALADCSACPAGSYLVAPCDVAAGFPFNDRVCGACERFSCSRAFEVSVGCPSRCVARAPVSFLPDWRNSSAVEPFSPGGGSNAVVRLVGRPGAALTVGLYRLPALRSDDDSVAVPGSNSTSHAKAGIATVSLVSWSGAWGEDAGAAALAGGSRGNWSSSSQPVRRGLVGAARGPGGSCVPVQPPLTSAPTARSFALTSPLPRTSSSPGLTSSRSLRRLTSPPSLLPLPLRIPRPSARRAAMRWHSQGSTRVRPTRRRRSTRPTPPGKRSIRRCPAPQTAAPHRRTLRRRPPGHLLCSRGSAGAATHSARPSSRPRRRLSISRCGSRRLSATWRCPASLPMTPSLREQTVSMERGPRLTPPALPPGPPSFRQNSTFTSRRWEQTLRLLPLRAWFCRLERSALRWEASPSHHQGIDRPGALRPTLLLQ